MLKNIIELYKEDNSAKEISRKLSVPLSTVYFYIKKLKLEDSVQAEYGVSLRKIDRMKRKIVRCAEKIAVNHVAVYIKTNGEKTACYTFQKGVVLFTVP